MTLTAIGCAQKVWACLLLFWNAEACKTYSH